MESSNTESPGNNERTAGDSAQLSATDVQAALKRVSRPSKRNIGLAMMLGIALILIQCARAGYLPEFDWSSGAGAVVLVAVLAVSLFAMVALAVLVAIPALPVVAEKSSTPKPYLGAIGLILAVLVGMVIISRLLAKWKVLDEWSDSLLFGVIVFLLVFGAPAGAAYVVAKKRVNAEGGGKLKLLESWWTNFTGLVVLPVVYGVVYLLLARYQDADLYSVMIFALVPVIPIISVIALVLLRPRNALPYQSVGLGLFVFFCIPASTGAFSLLGLGDRTVEFYLEKSQYSEELARGKMRPDPQNGNVYRVFLRLRLGSDIAVSADDSEWGRSADVVAIPRDAVRGLRFVPPPLKSGVVQPAGKAAKNPKHLVLAASQWQTKQDVTRFVEAREAEWKTEQKAGLSAAQADWLEWARTTAKELSPFADGYPVLVDAEGGQKDPEATSSRSTGR